MSGSPQARPTIIGCGRSLDFEGPAEIVEHVMSRRALLRRRVAVLICLAPVALVAISLGIGLCGSQSRFSGIGWMGVGAGIGVINQWFTYGRPLLHLAGGRERGAYGHSSGIPMVGTLMTVMAATFGFGALWTAALGLFVLAIDTGGSPWFLVATWNDESLWDPATTRRSHRDS